MNPFESMQALADLWGKAPGKAFAAVSQTCSPAMADTMAKAAGMGARRRSRPSRRTRGLRGGAPSFEQSWSSAQDSRRPLDQGLQGADQANPIRSSPRCWPRSSTRAAGCRPPTRSTRRSSAWRKGRGWPTCGTWSASSPRCSTPGWPAPAQPRAQQGHARGLDEGGRRLRQDAERAGREGRAPLDSWREVLTLWGETANEVLLETQRSDAFLKTQRELLKASTDLAWRSRTWPSSTARCSAIRPGPNSTTSTRPSPSCAASCGRSSARPPRAVRRSGQDRRRNRKPRQRAPAKEGARPPRQEGTS